MAANPEPEQRGANLLSDGFQISIVVPSGTKKERTDKCVQIISKPKYGSEQERKGANLLPNGFQMSIVVTSGTKIVSYPTR